METLNSKINKKKNKQNKKQNGMKKATIYSTLHQFAIFVEKLKELQYNCQEITSNSPSLNSDMYVRKYNFVNSMKN